MWAEFTRVGTSPETSWRYRVLRQPAFDFFWHFHLEYELVLITRGTGTRIVADSIESYAPGDLTLIGPDTSHSYVSTTGTSDQEAILIQFQRDFLGPAFFDRPEFTPVTRLLDSTAPATFAPAPEVVDTCREMADMEAPDRTLALVRILLTLAHDDQARALPGGSHLHRLSRPARQRLGAACTYLQASFAGEVALSEVAEVAHMSPAAFSRFFRQALGRTMTEYLTQLRIAAACQLLRDSDLPIAEIATTCGYGNLSNFNRRFRSLMNSSPREYRRAIAAYQDTRSEPLSRSAAVTPAAVAHA